MYSLILAIFGVSSFAAIELSTQKVEFGEVSLNSYANQSITITSTSDKGQRLSVYDYCGGVLEVSNLCPNYLQPGQSCIVDIDFAPRIPGRVRCNGWIETSEGDNFTFIIRGLGTRF